VNYFSDESEWQWLFKNGIDWDSIINLYYPSFPTEDGFENKEEVIDFLKELLTQTGEWAGTSIKEIGELLNKDGAGTVKDGRTVPGPHLERLYKEARELSVYGLPLPREFGGLETPVSIYMIFLGQLSRSCLSSSSQLAFFTSMGEMIYRYCDEETKQRLIPKVIAGELSGSMNLTEPGCGSDLGMMKTSATLQEDGTYHLNGTKIFITNGGGGVAFVLAKVKGDADDLSGISMFFVEQDHPGKEGLNFVVANNEDKMGMTGSFTTEIVYENTIGKLVGEQGKGFKYMLHLMNEARICVGIQALGTIEAGLGYAREYAEGRVQFGKPLTELPLMRRNLEDYETERDAIRALIIDTVSKFDQFLFLENKRQATNDLTEEEKVLFDDMWLWTRKRTPLVKYYACEAAVNLTQRSIQVLGGYGYMKEYPVERYHRDSFAPLLYEGTSQIQALMALKDIIKYAIKDPKSFFGNVFFKHPGAKLLTGAEEWNQEFSSVHYRFKKKMLGLLFKTLKPEASKMLDFKNWANEDNVNELMEHAETLCQALSYMETLRVLAEHADKDSSRAALFHRYKILVVPRLEAVYTDWKIRAGATS
jgi:alkylation response protein AidB-like acyl-CoA dehydrogenase